MPITTTDVVTNIVPELESAKNGTLIVSCMRTGEYKSIDSEFELPLGYSSFEAKLTSRFDNVTYYTIGNNTVIGG